MTLTVAPGTASNGGSPAHAAARDMVLGLDLGGTKVAALLVDAHDRVLARTTERTDPGDPTRSMLAAAEATLSQVPGSRDRLAAVGVCAPGRVDSDEGVLRMAVNLPVRDLRIGQVVGAALGAPCFVDHDARGTAMWLSRQDQDGGSLAYLSVGTGISAGIVIDGQPLRGDHGLAGEVGHFVAVADGPRCGCGLDGCLEAVASGSAVARQAGEAMERGEASSLAGSSLTGEAVYDHAAAGDPLAVSITTAAGEHLARAVRALAVGFGVSRIVVGGGPARAGEAFTAPLRKAMARERSASELARGSIPEVELLPVDSEATAWGAVAVARTGLAATRELRKGGSRPDVLP